MEKQELYDAYYSKKYDIFLELFNNYIKDGYGIDEKIIYCYINILLVKKKYEHAIKLIKILEKNIKKFNTYEEIARLYHRSFKPKEAERVLLQKETPIHDYNLLIDIKLLEGKIEEAENILNICLSNHSSDKDIERLKKYKKIISNHNEKGAFIETEYTCFKENGNKLEKGHIVFLKKNPDSACKIEENIKLNNIPYMIWKIENDKIYMFPVSNKEKKHQYKLFQQNYPNSVGDRIIKDHVYTTTEENILSVQDKLLKEDFDAVLKNMCQATYLQREEDKKANKEFIEYVLDSVEKNDVIEFIDPIERKKTFRLVLGVQQDGYEVIKINLKYNIVTGEKIEFYEKNRLVYDVLKLEKSKIDELLEQIRENIMSKTR